MNLLVLYPLLYACSKAPEGIIRAFNGAEVWKSIHRNVLKFSTMI